MNKQGEDFVAQVSKECENSVVYFDEFAAEIWSWYVDFSQWISKFKVKEVRTLRANQTNLQPCESNRILFFICKPIFL